MAEPKNNKQLSELLQPLSGERQKSETDIAVVACNDWLRMGEGRNLRELIDQYQLKATRIKGFKPPTLSYSTIKGWSTAFEWSERASLYDANFEALRNEERQKVFSNELVSDFGRVRKLVDLAEFLEGQLYEQDMGGNFHNVWNPDVKGVGSGLDAQIVDIERFNPAIIEQYRATLADIAKEVGGRVEKKEVTGANGGAIGLKVIVEYADYNPKITAPDTRTEDNS
jgi:hypothetical protein